MKKNPWLMMAICCIPILLLIGAVYFFGAGRGYLYWAVLLLCPLMHYFMMRDHHSKERKNVRIFH